MRRQAGINSAAVCPGHEGQHAQAGASAKDLKSLLFHPRHLFQLFSTLPLVPAGAALPLHECGSEYEGSKGPKEGSHAPAAQRTQDKRHERAGRTTPGS